ncbi:hypothetical protein [Patulibacter sp. SYSU D01012]|uniref:hypothetical protein n=1 Tax=Patulibacter sp. SYSU D01012 TaxID=2817381 RepID=UPI001B30DEFB|nr:hypothetical protein [Patulibacter sp. SYSU D01012]
MEGKVRIRRPDSDEVVVRYVDALEIGGRRYVVRRMTGAPEVELARTPALPGTRWALPGAIALLVLGVAVLLWTPHLASWVEEVGRVVGGLLAGAAVVLAGRWDRRDGPPPARDAGLVFCGLLLVAFALLTMAYGGEDVKGLLDVGAALFAVVFVALWGRIVDARGRPAPPHR